MLDNVDAPIRGGLVLFPGFELLDAAGPLDVLGKLPQRLVVSTLAQVEGPIRSAQGTALVAEHSLVNCGPLELLIVPGGAGTRAEVENQELLSAIRSRADEATVVFSVCTGAALLARAGVLDGHRATTNKLAFEWVRDQSAKVEWVPHARWVEDGRFVTSSGVAAGIDAAFAVLRRLLGNDIAERVAKEIEYEPERDPENDPFAAI
jgi:transcriptional regulator GlxA family with amidase domain